MNMIPIKSILLVPLMVLLEVPYIYSGETKTQVQEILTNPDNRWKDLHLLPSQLIGSMILRKHPLVHFILKKAISTSTVQEHITSRIHSTLYGTRFIADCTTSGDLCLTVGGDKTVKLWETKSGTCRHTLSGHTCRVHSIVFNLSGDRIITSSSDNTAKIWDITTGKCLTTLRGHTDSVTFSQFNSSGDLVITTCWDGTARLWETNSGKCLHTMMDDKKFLDFAVFNSSGTIVLTSSKYGGAPKLWQTSSGRYLYTLETLPVFQAAAFNDVGDRILTASWVENIAKIWETSSGTCLQTLKGHTQYISSVVFIGTRDMCLTASRDRSIKLWDTHKGECLQTLSIADFFSDWDRLYRLRFTRSGDKIIGTLNNGTVILHDISLFLKLHNFFSRDDSINLNQAFVLIGIYEIIVFKKLLRKDESSYLPYYRRLTNMFKSFSSSTEEQAMNSDCTVFDFRKCHHLQADYEKLPQEIRRILEEYVRKVPSKNDCSTASTTDESDFESASSSEES